VRDLFSRYNAAANLFSKCEERCESGKRFGMEADARNLAASRGTYPDFSRILFMFISINVD